MNEITKTNTSSALAAMQKKFAAAANKAPVANFLPILKFAKQGEWLLGRDQDEVSIGTKLVIRAESLEEGWLGWQNGKVVGETMRPVSGDDINKMKRKEIVPVTKKDGWTSQYTFECKFLKDEQPCIFKTTTNGGEQVFFQILKAIAAQIATRPEFPNPIVTLEQDSYTHPDYGRTYKPALEIVDWMAIDSTDLASANPMQEQLDFEEEETLEDLM